MIFVMHQDCVSPHQVPLARELVARLGAENFRYVYRDKEQADRVKIGWKMSGEDSWFVHIGTQPEMAHDLIENAEAMLTMFRDTDLIARRCAKGLKTFYDSERWFKPISIGVGQRCRCSLPGCLKLLAPSYFKMAMKMAALLFKYPNFRYLPIGPHAARDMRLICRLYSILHLHLQPTPTFIPWGYFVEPSNNPKSKSTLPLQLPTTTKVLYVGRLLKLKHVDTIIRAVALLNSQLSTLNPQPSPCSPRSPWPKYTLTIVGDGPEKSHLQKLANHLSPTPTTYYNFLPSVPIHEVRPLMRFHDILVFSSDASDGWGAVVSEALSEGTPVIGTYETGASAALLPDTQLFHCGNYKELAKKLSALQLQLSTTTIPSAYTPSGAAERIVNILNVKHVA